MRSDPRHILIVGGDGRIARALRSRLLERGDRVTRTTRRPSSGDDAISFDMADESATAEDLPQADVVVIAAAMAGFAECREQPNLARRVNVAAPAAVAEAMAARGARTVLLSTAAVFHATVPTMAATTVPNAGSAYGQLKAAAEQRVLGASERNAVLRLTKVLDPEMALVSGWVDRLRKGLRVNAFSDLTVAPLSLDHAVNALLAVIDSREVGIFQMSGARDISYAELARYLAHRVGADPALVEEGSGSQAGIPASELPPFTGLDVSRLKAVAGLAAPDPLDVLEQVFGHLWAKTAA